MSTIPNAAAQVGGPADSLPDLLAGLSGCLAALPFPRFLLRRPLLRRRLSRGQVLIFYYSWR